MFAEYELAWLTREDERESGKIERGVVFGAAQSARRSEARLLDISSSYRNKQLTLAGVTGPQVSEAPKRSEV